MTRSLLFAALLLALATPACSSRGASPSAAVATTAPRRLGADRPDLSSVRLTGNSEVQLTVMINTDGSPDMQTLRFTKTGAADLRQALTDWIARGRFEPARANGEPVRAEYRFGMKSEVRRVPR